jgi:hypothetical protein
MRIPVQKLDEAVVRSRYPISDRAPGWYFRISEQSAGVWRVEGTDLWGRAVSKIGTDENLLLDDCVAAAVAINDRIAAHGV